MRTSQPTVLMHTIRLAILCTLAGIAESRERISVAPANGKIAVVVEPAQLSEFYGDGAARYPPMHRRDTLEAPPEEEEKEVESDDEMPSYLQHCTDLPGDLTGDAWSDGNDGCSAFGLHLPWCKEYGHENDNGDGSAKMKCCACGGGQQEEVAEVKTDILGQYIDLRHPGCVRAITGDSDGYDVHGSDSAAADGKCDGETDVSWGPYAAGIDGASIIVDFSEKGGPRMPRARSMQVWA